MYIYIDIQIYIYSHTYIQCRVITRKLPNFTCTWKHRMLNTHYVEVVGFHLISGATWHMALGTSFCQEVLLSLSICQANLIFQYNVIGVVHGPENDVDLHRSSKMLEITTFQISNNHISSEQVSTHIPIHTFINMFINTTVSNRMVTLCITPQLDSLCINQTCSCFLPVC